MKKVVGHSIQTLPIEGLQHVSNLIDFDGPLLSHYIDKYHNSFLYYWVDQDDQNNRWLVWKVDESRLHLYLIGEVSLHDLFPNEGELLYVIDVDSKINFTQILLVYADAVDEKYRPEINSYYNFDIPEIYTEKLLSVNYLKSLRERALFFDVKNTSDRYGKTPGLEDVWSVLQNVGKSISEYIDFKVKEILHLRLTDQNRIKSAAFSLSSPNRYRLVYLNLNSFHVGIAPDSLNIDHQAMDPSIEEFKSQAFVNYQNEVLDNDFSSSEDIDILISKFPDEKIRKKIFDPLVKIINNDNITINVSNFSKKFNKKYSRIPKIEKNKLSPTRSSGTFLEETVSQTLMVAYFVADKNAQQITLFPKDVSKRLVYTKETDRFPLEIETLILASGEVISLTYPIEIEVNFNDGYFSVVYEPLGIFINANDRNRVVDQFNIELRRLYQEFVTGNSNFAVIFQRLLS